MGVKSDKRHMGQEHRAAARKAKGCLSIPKGTTAGVMVTGEVAGGGDGCQRLKLKFQTKNIPLTTSLLD